MPATSEISSTFAASLAEGLGASFSVLPADGYVAVLHPELGMAAVVDSDSEARAIAAAEKLTALSDGIGVSWPSMHFAISATKVMPPWLVRSGPNMSVDIIAGMARGSATRLPFGADKAAKVAVALVKAASLVQGSKEGEPSSLSPHIIRMAEACIEKTLAGRSMWVAGVPIDVKDAAGPAFMLPALLVHAAQTWTVPVVAANGKGGFLIKLTPDPESILGYRVTGVDASAPLLLFLPLVNLIRRSFANEECILDESVQRFADFLSINGLDDDVLGDVDVRVAATG